VKRLGLFGGSFDPVHTGHLLVARAALEELALDRLCFIPAAQSPFKPDRTLADGADRARWLRLALAGWTACDVVTDELVRQGISYTVDTVRDFARRFPAAELFWLVGGDHAATLPKWREAAALASLVVFVVAPRPGRDAALDLPPGFSFHVLRSPLSSVSSSDVRQRIRAGRPLEGWVPPAVIEAVVKYPLYL
jgi:nicotinate-nucleotide adenylyltransferase